MYVLWQYFICISSACDITFTVYRNMLCLINEINLHRAGLVLGWVTACG